MCERPGSLRGRGPRLPARPQQCVHLQSRVRACVHAESASPSSPPVAGRMAALSRLLLFPPRFLCVWGGSSNGGHPAQPAARQAQAGASVLRRELLSPVSGIAAAAAKSLQACPTLCDPPRRQPTRPPRPWGSPGKNTGVGCHFLLQCMKVKSGSEVAQSCLTLSDPRDCSPPASSIHGIFQARVLEWGAIAFSGGTNY